MPSFENTYTIRGERVEAKVDLDHGYIRITRFRPSTKCLDLAEFESFGGSFEDFLAVKCRVGTRRIRPGQRK